MRALPWLFTATFLVMLAAIPLYGALSDRVGRVPALRAAVALQATAYLAFLVARDLPSLLGASALYGFGYASVSTLFPPLISDFFGRGHAGAIVGALFAIAGWLIGTSAMRSSSHTATSRPSQYHVSLPGSQSTP